MKNIVLLLLTIMSTISVSGCATTNHCYEEWKKSNHDLAIRECSRQISGEIKTAHVEYAYNTRGIAYKAKEQYILAIADFDKAIELNPNFTFAFNNRGTVFAKTGQFDRALADYDKAIALNPRCDVAYANSGYAHYRKSENDKALADYSRALELNPKSYLAYMCRGDTYRSMNELDKAIADYDKAVELNSSNEHAHISRGLLKESQLQYGLAITDYRKAIDNNPKYEYAYLNLLIATWLAKTDAAEALGKLREHVTTHSTTKWIRIVSNYYLQAGTINEQDILQEAQHGKNDKEINERLCEAYYYLAIKRLLAGDRNGAEEFFRKSVATAVFYFREYASSKSMLVRLEEGNL